MKSEGTQRLEAFSDGVFAIAITLLILEVRVPHTDAGGTLRLGQALRELWPSYFAYVLSFVHVGIYWANHHSLYKLYVKVDHVFNLLNVFFLMGISFVPFPTAVLAQHLMNPASRHSAIGFYVLGMLLPAVGWLACWLYASWGFRLLDPRLDPRFVRSLTQQFLLSNLFYAISLWISCWNARLALAICVGLTMLYLLPPKKPIYQT